MTFEKVLQVFHDYLEEDPMYEIVTTSHGYALMEWGENRQEWNDCWHLSTPEMMMSKLLDCYEMFLMWQVLSGTAREELNDEERKQIDAQCARLRKLCLNG